MYSGNLNDVFAVKSLSGFIEEISSLLNPGAKQEFCTIE